MHAYYILKKIFIFVKHNNKNLKNVNNENISLHQPRT